MLFDLKTGKKVRSSGWQPASGVGCERLASKMEIGDLLRYLEEDRIILSLADGKRALGQTILERYQHDRLQFSTPSLPSKTLLLRLSFRHRGKLLHFFDTKITSASGSQLLTTVPDQLFRLQRRNHYRVEAPLGSSASFSIQKGTVARGAVRNVSAGGLLLCADSAPRLQQGDQLCAISLDLLLFGCNLPFRLAVSGGRIVRSSPQDGRHCFGTSLKLAPGQEDALMTYVRLRERELLSKRGAERYRS